jgi:hypothetical protein
VFDARRLFVRMATLKDSGGNSSMLDHIFGRKVVGQDWAVTASEKSFLHCLDVFLSD